MGHTSTGTIASNALPVNRAPIGRRGPERILENPRPPAIVSKIDIQRQHHRAPGAGHPRHAIPEIAFIKNVVD